jgi:hypothetical protein
MLSVEDVLGIGRERRSHDKLILAYSDGQQDRRGTPGTVMCSTKTLDENVTYDVFRVYFSIIDQQQHGDSHFGQQDDRYVMVWGASYRTLGAYRCSRSYHTRSLCLLHSQLQDNDCLDSH